ncbi:MAG: ORF6N domain-containing protein [Terrimicrobiaceae bacterium]
MEIELIPIESQIHLIRGRKVMLASDLAQVYGAETRTLNQAVKRNVERFPADFMFQLTLEEAEGLQRSRSQSVIMKRGQNIKYLPYAFTEHGAIMLASVLNSKRATEMSVYVVRAFVRLREAIAGNKELAAKIAALENKVGNQDRDIQTIFSAIRQLMAPPVQVPRHIKGFGK